VDALNPGRPGIDKYRQRRRLGSKDSRPTIARKLSTLSSFYTYGITEYPHLVPENPLDRVKRPKLARESTRSGLDLDQALEVLAAAERVGGRDAAVVLLLAWTGMRAAELRACEVGDLGQERGERTITVTRKGGKRQALMLYRDAWVALSAYLDGRTEGPLIVGSRGGPISRYEVGLTLDRIVPQRIQDEKRVTPHSMRHTFATLALDAGADIRQVQRMLGHDSMETTMRYDHARGRVDQSPAHALARLFGGTS
jgi:site-specific recombinase XerD